MTGNITSTARNQNARINVYDSGGFQAGENIAATPCAVLAVLATNKGAAVAYVQLFDSKDGPADVPAFVPVAVPPGETVSVSFNDVSGSGVFGLSTYTGLTWGASSTAATYTTDATDVWVLIRYTN